MSVKSTAISPLRHADRFYIGGQWVAPSSDATIEVIDSGTEEFFFSVAEAQAADMDRAVGAARQAFDDGPWPRMTHAERAEYLRALGAGLAARADEIGQIWPREAGVLHRIAQGAGKGAAGTFDVLRRAGRHVRVGAGGAAHRARVRTAGARAGRRGRRHHPLERTTEPDQLQGRPRPHRRVHRGPQVLTGGARRGLPGGGGRRGDRAATGRPQRGHRRPRGLGTAGARPAGGQDHLHRLDCRRPPDRLAVRRTDRPLHPRARGEVGRGGPGRRRPRRHRRTVGPGRVHDDRSGLLVADPDRGAPSSVTTS